MAARLAMSLSSLFAAIVPVLCGLIGVVLSCMPISLSGGVVPPPLLGFMPVYFWGLIRPDLMTPAAVFAVGLAEDLLSGSPPGFWTLSFIASYAFVDRQRDSFAGLAGIGAILGFALAMLIAAAAAYLIAALSFWHWPPLTPLVLQVVVTVLCYVPALPLMNGIQHRVVGPLRSEF
jgi:rod shape-determining protein MreD